MHWQPLWRSPQVLRILYPTDLSSASARGDALVAQLLAPGQSVVDIIHVPPASDPRERVEVWTELDRCLWTADARRVRRHLVSGDGPGPVITDLCASGLYGLVVMPEAPSFALWPWRSWRLGASARATVLARGKTPLLTMGRRVPIGRIRRVGCHVTLTSGGDSHVRAAATWAAHLGATLHLLHVLPTIDDAMLADAAGRPLTRSDAEAAMAQLQARSEAASATLGLAARGSSLRRLVREQQIDLLVVPTAIALDRDRLARGLRRMPCPVLCIPPGEALPGWWRATAQD